MKLIKQKLAVAVAIACVISMFPFTAHADQPFMQAALKDLKSAQTYLKRATADKGGHRQKALDLTASAISAVNDGIAYDRRNPNNRRRNDDTSLEDRMMPVAGQQVNMQNAIVQLRSALDNLEKASPDKGGYRTRAIDLVRDAIAETQKGIDYDRRN